MTWPDMILGGHFLEGWEMNVRKDRPKMPALRIVVFSTNRWKQTENVHMPPSPSPPTPTHHGERLMKHGWLGTAYHLPVISGHSPAWEPIRANHFKQDINNRHQMADNSYLLRGRCIINKLCNMKRLCSGRNQTSHPHMYVCKNSARLKCRCSGIWECSLGSVNIFMATQWDALQKRLITKRSSAVG